MLGFQTLSCLHDIPVIRASTDKLQDVYAKAKDTSVLIRLPCNLAETVADKSIKIALTVANPLVKPLRGPVRVIDDFAVQKLRQMEAKYPVINTPTKDVVESFNEKTEPVRNVMNSVKETTTSTIQHGKETVSNVASATVNKASNVADTVFSFCETHVPGKTTPVQRQDFGRRSSLLTDRLRSAFGSLFDSFFESIHLSVTWFRMLTVFFLLKIKQTNDVVLNKMQRTPILNILSQRLLIITGSLLELLVTRIRPDDRTMAELKKMPKQQQNHPVQQQHFVSRQTYKPDAFVTTRQSVVVTKQDTVISRNVSNAPVVTKPMADYSNMTDKEQLYARLAAASNGAFNSDDIDIVSNPIVSSDRMENPDIARLHAQLNPTDVELLYSRLPSDVIPNVENPGPLTEDQQKLHAKLIGAELERQGYVEENNDYDD